MSTSSLVLSPRLPRRLTDEELREPAGIGGAGLRGCGALVGELVADEFRLVTAGEGSRGEVRFTIDAAMTRLAVAAGETARSSLASSQ